MGQTGRPEAAGAGDQATATEGPGTGWVLGSRRYGAGRQISKQKFLKVLGLMQSVVEQASILQV